MGREKFIPTNGTDAIMIDIYCSNCKHDANMDCPIITKSFLANSPYEMPDEWTADDCTGRGFECSKKEVK